MAAVWEWNYCNAFKALPELKLDHIRGHIRKPSHCNAFKALPELKLYA